MASLESKLLDGKNAGYCSSSEGEDDDGGFKQVNDDDEHQARVMKKMGGGKEIRRSEKVRYGKDEGVR